MPDLGQMDAGPRSTAELVVRPHDRGGPAVPVGEYEIDPGRYTGTEPRRRRLALDMDIELGGCGVRGRDQHGGQTDGSEQVGLEGAEDTADHETDERCDEHANPRSGDLHVRVIFMSEPIAWHRNGPQDVGDHRRRRHSLELRVWSKLESMGDDVRRDGLHVIVCDIEATM